MKTPKTCGITGSWKMCEKCEDCKTYAFIVKVRGCAHCGREMKTALLSGIGTCPPCSTKWAKG